MSKKTAANLTPEMFACDSLRIVEYGGTKFLLLGWNCNTKDEAAFQWMKNGMPVNFDYIKEKVVASGKTDQDLIASAQEYLRISKLTMEEYLREVTR